MRQLREARLSLHPFSDIFSNASEAVSRARIVFHRERPIVYPANRSVRAHDPECLVISIDAGTTSCGINATAILLVNRPNKRSRIAFQLIGTDPENSLRGRADVNRLVLLLIENPEHLRNIGRKLPQLLLAFAQGICSACRAMRNILSAPVGWRPAGS